MLSRVSATSGLSKLDPASGKITRYSSSTEFLNGSIQRSSFRDLKGQLYFGGHDGVTMVRPEAVSVNSFPPQVAITNISDF